MRWMPSDEINLFWTAWRRVCNFIRQDDWIEVYYTACSLLVKSKNSFSKLHRQKRLIWFSVHTRFGLRVLAPRHGSCRARLAEISFHTMYQINGFRKWTPQQNRQFIVLTSPSKQQVDSFVGEMTFWNHSINTLCKIRLAHRDTTEWWGMKRRAGRP